MVRDAREEERLVRDVIIEFFSAWREDERSVCCSEGSRSWDRRDVLRIMWLATTGAEELISRCGNA